MYVVAMERAGKDDSNHTKYSNRQKLTYRVLEIRQRLVRNYVTHVLQGVDGYCAC